MTLRLNQIPVVYAPMIFLDIYHSHHFIYLCDKHSSYTADYKTELSLWLTTVSSASTVPLTKKRFNRCTLSELTLMIIALSSS